MALAMQEGQYYSLPSCLGDNTIGTIQYYSLPSCMHPSTVCRSALSPCEWRCHATDRLTHPCLPPSADVESAAVGKLAAQYPSGAHSDVRPEPKLHVIPEAHSLVLLRYYAPFRPSIIPEGPSGAPNRALAPAPLYDYHSESAPPCGRVHCLHVVIATLGRDPSSSAAAAQT